MSKQNDKKQSTESVAKSFEKLVHDFFATNINNVVNRTDVTIKANEGLPDIEILDKFYIECTVASKGQDDDGITWEAPTWSGKGERAMYCVPEEVVDARTQFVFRRLAQRLLEKQTQFKNDRINGELPLIVAITMDLDSLSHEYYWDDIYEDAFFKLLYDNGSGTTIQFHLDGSCEDLPYKDGKIIKKPSGNELPAGIFNAGNNNFNMIAAILFVSPRAVKEAIRGGKAIGIKDMFLCINKNAKVKITQADWATLLKPKILREYLVTATEE